MRITRGQEFETATFKLHSFMIRLPSDITDRFYIYLLLVGVEQRIGRSPRIEAYCINYLCTRLDTVQPRT